MNVADITTPQEDQTLRAVIAILEDEARLSDRRAGDLHVGMHCRAFHRELRDLYNGHARTLRGLLKSRC